MAKKKTGYSKKSKDWFGRTVINHYNDRNEKTGFSKNTKNFWGTPVTERYNAKGEKTGYNKDAKTVRGERVTERFNTKGEKIGHNKRSETFWGTPITERYNPEGEKTGYSKKAQIVWGTPITEHYNEPAGHSASGASSASYAHSEGSSPATPARSSGSGWMIVTAVVVIGLTVSVGMSDAFQPWIVDLLAPLPSASRQSSPRSTPRRHNNPGQLLPVDEASQDPSFAKFREKLLSAIGRKDRGFVLGILSPTIKIGFGDNPDTSTEFARVWNIESPDSRLWAELQKVLSMGGTFSTENGARVFCAPYVTSAWPEAVDAFAYTAVTGKNVALRRSPDPASASLGLLSYNIVRVADWTENRELARVVATNGATGFVNSEYLRSPIAYRAFFKQLNGKWTLTAFVAGD